MNIFLLSISLKIVTETALKFFITNFNQITYDITMPQKDDKKKRNSCHHFVTLLDRMFSQLLLPSISRIFSKV